mgnify:CR=1 FL=1
MELQLAMDLFSLEDAVAMAQRLQADADIIEIGTPLLMREGIRAIRIMQESCPKCRILADCKIMDAGGLEAEMAFSAGADIVTVCEAALGAARQAGKQILVDLIAVKDLETRAAWADQAGADYIQVHTAFDGRSGGSPLAELLRIQPVVTRGKLAAAGGIGLSSMEQLAAARPSLIVLGSKLFGAPDPVEELKKIRAAAGGEA